MQNTAVRNPLFDRQKHPFHLVRPSPFPFFVGVFLLCWLIPLTFYMHGTPIPGFSRPFMVHLGFFAIVGVVMQWFLAILAESRQGFHTKKVQSGLRLGMILFIISEVMLFFAFFWAFFHFSLAPSTFGGTIWPPTGTQALSAWGLPLVNTLLLLSSGATITAAHAYILKGNNKHFFWFLAATILLGAVFLVCQGFEYKYGVKFSWRDNVYGSIFFITTGFHGLHVTIGTMFLLFCLIRHFFTTMLPLWAQEGRFGSVVRFLEANAAYNPAKGLYWAMTPEHHFGFEAAAWYWHFVDVVWLFLFLTVYWWGGA